jgi:hypothetical protein
VLDLDPRAALRQRREQEEKERQERTRAREKEERACKTLPELVRLGYQRQYKSPEGWAAMKMQLRQRWRRGTPRARVVRAGA